MVLQLDNSALVVAGRGSIYTAAANLALPAGGLMTLAQDMSGVTSSIAGWERVANTSRETLPEFSIESGETTPLGTWDNENVRTVYGSSVVSWTFRPGQMDVETASWAGNGWKDGTAAAVIASSGWAFKAAYAIVIFDGTLVSGFYIPNNDSVLTGLPTLGTAAFSEMEINNTIGPAAPAAIPLGVDGRTALMKIYPPVAYTAS